MNDINMMMISGVVVEPPKMASTQSGKMVCKMRIKSEREYNGNSSHVFIDVDVWESAGAGYANTIPQGAGVVVAGRFTVNTWQDQNGNKRSTPVCVASTIIPLMAAQMPQAQQPIQQCAPTQYCQPQYYQQGAPMQGGGYGVPAQQPPQMPPMQMQAQPAPQTYQQYHQQAVAANAPQPAQNEQQPSGKQAQDGEAKDGDLPF
jgi:single-stranded DNA-binding protein